MRKRIGQVEVALQTVGKRERVAERRLMVVMVVVMAAGVGGSGWGAEGHGDAGGLVGAD